MPLPETAEGTIAAAALDPVLERLAGADALALGPGLSSEEETAEFARDLVRSCPAPMIVDADGLNAFAGRAVRSGRPQVGGRADTACGRVRALDRRRLPRPRCRSPRARPIAGEAGQRDHVVERKPFLDSRAGRYRADQPDRHVDAGHGRKRRRPHGRDRRRCWRGEWPLSRRRRPAPTCMVWPASWPAATWARGRSPVTWSEGSPRPSPA